MLNKPTYLLICLIEECAEVIQRVCKAIRFGMDEIQPGQPMNNLDRIVQEMDDLQGVTAMLDADCNLRVLRFNDEAITNKIAKIRKYMPLSQERGMLEDKTPTAEGKWIAIRTVEDLPKEDGNYLWKKRRSLVTASEVLWFEQSYGEKYRGVLFRLYEAYMPIPEYTPHGQEASE